MIRPAALTLQRFSRRDLRLLSGLVLFAYVAAHLVNHALGLVSIAAAERGLRVAVAVWQSAPGTLLLYGAAASHIALALLALYEHRSLRMPPRELLRIALGFAIPTLLIGHAVGTRLAFEIYGHPPDYAHVVWMLWHSGRGGRQIALLVPGWLHGCLGLYFAFGRRPAFVRMRLALFAFALLLPAFAVLGFLSMVKEVSLLAGDPAWVAAITATASDAQHRALGNVRDGLLALYFATIAAVLLGRLGRAWREERGGRLVTIDYPGRSVRVPRGWSVLEASRSHHIAHVSMCGGRARCSTCRVRVVAGAAHCPAPGDDERRTLARIRASEGTRLACQLRPTGDVEVIALVLAGGRPARSAGGVAERDVAVMLADLHWPSGERPLAHDLLYAQARFSRIVGDTTRAAGGVATQFTGDRVTVLFGLDVDAVEAKRQALACASELGLRLAALSEQLQRGLGCRSAHAIHVHAGLAAVGDTGDGVTRTLTAAGEAIDVVRQLAALPMAEAPPGDSGGHDSRTVVTRTLCAGARPSLDGLAWHELRLPPGQRIDVARMS